MERRRGGQRGVEGLPGRRVRSVGPRDVGLGSSERRKGRLARLRGALELPRAPPHEALRGGDASVRRARGLAGSPREGDLVLEEAALGGDVDPDSGRSGCGEGAKGGERSSQLVFGKRGLARGRRRQGLSIDQLHVGDRLGVVVGSGGLGHDDLRRRFALRRAAFLLGGADGDKMAQRDRSRAASVARVRLRRRGATTGGAARRGGGRGGRRRAAAAHGP